MKGYYCFTRSGFEIFYVPPVICRISSDLRGVDYLFSPCTENQTFFRTVQERVTRERLENKRWSVAEVDLPGDYVNLLIDISKGSSIQTDKLFDFISEEGIDDICLRRIPPYAKHKEEQEWWERGEPWNEEIINFLGVNYADTI